VLAAAFPALGIGFHGVAFGLALAQRFPKSEILPYWIAQVIGGCIAAAVLYFIATGKVNAEIGNFAANGYGEHSPGNYSFSAALLSELVMTFMFLMVILGATDPRAPAGFAPIAGFVYPALFSEEA
jgi:aquaporin Z